MSCCDCWVCVAYAYIHMSTNMQFGTSSLRQLTHQAAEADTVSGCVNETSRYMRQHQPLPNSQPWHLSLSEWCFNAALCIADCLYLSNSAMPNSTRCKTRQFSCLTTSLWHFKFCCHSSRAYGPCRKRHRYEESYRYSEPNRIKIMVIVATNPSSCNYTASFVRYYIVIFL